MAKTTELRRLKDQERKQRTREALLDASERVFAARGYHATQVADIVGEAGVGQGTFYRHFQSKRGIFEELFDRLVAGLLAGFEAPLATFPETLEEYRDMSLRGAHHATGVIEHRADTLRIILRDGPSVDEAFAARLEGIYERMAALGRLYLDHAVRVEMISPCDTELVAQLIVGYATRILSLWLDGRLPGRESEQIVRDLVDFALVGFAGQWPS